MFQAPTEAVLAHYDSDFARKKIFGYYLEKLVEGWLRDLAYQWKSPTPPRAAELAQIGLLEQLRDGTTLSEVNLQTQEFLAA